MCANIKSISENNFEYKKCSKIIFLRFVADFFTETTHFVIIIIINERPASPAPIFIVK